LRRVIWQKFTKVSEVLAAFIIRAMIIALIMEAEDSHHNIFTRTKLVKLTPQQRGLLERLIIMQMV
jgi:hypothetical protein